jgi:hypothetical protein
MEARQHEFVKGLGAKIVAYFLNEQVEGNSRNKGVPKRVPREQFVQTYERAIDALDDFALREQLSANFDSVCDKLWQQYKQALKEVRGKAASEPVKAAKRAKAAARSIDLLSADGFAKTLEYASADRSLSYHQELLAIPIINAKQAEQLVASLQEALQLAGSKSRANVECVVSLAACGNIGVPLPRGLAVAVLSVVMEHLRIRTPSPAPTIAQRLFRRVATAAALDFSPGASAMRHPDAALSACTEYLGLCRLQNPDSGEASAEQSAALVCVVLLRPFAGGVDCSSRSADLLVRFLLLLSDKAPAVWSCVAGFNPKSGDVPVPVNSSDYVALALDQLFDHWIRHQTQRGGDRMTPVAYLQMVILGRLLATTVRANAVAARRCILLQLRSTQQLPSDVAKALNQTKRAKAVEMLLSPKAYPSERLSMLLQEMADGDADTGAAVGTRGAVGLFYEDRDAAQVEHEPASKIVPLVAAAPAPKAKRKQLKRPLVDQATPELDSVNVVGVRRTRRQKPNE